MKYGVIHDRSLDQGEPYGLSPTRMPEWDARWAGRVRKASTFSVETRFLRRAMRRSEIRGPPAAGAVHLSIAAGHADGLERRGLPPGSRDVSSRNLQRADALKVAGPRAASVRDVSHPVPTKLHSIA